MLYNWLPKLQTVKTRTRKLRMYVVANIIRCKIKANKDDSFCGFAWCNFMGNYAIEISK